MELNCFSLEHGPQSQMGSVILPIRYLYRLQNLISQVPLYLKISSLKNQIFTTFLQFEEMEFICLPQWMMSHLQVVNGERVMVELIRHLPIIRTMCINFPSAVDELIKHHHFQVFQKDLIIPNHLQIIQLLDKHQREIPVGRILGTVEFLIKK